MSAVIVVVPATGPARLDEQHDLMSLKVVAEAAATGAHIAQALQATRAGEPDHLWIPAGVLQLLATPSDGWEKAFAAMLDKVEPYGWYDRARDAVKVHVERM